MSDQQDKMVLLSLSMRVPLAFVMALAYMTASAYMMASARLQVSPVPSGSTLSLVTVPSSTIMENLLHLRTSVDCRQFD